MRLKILLFLLICASFPLKAQVYFPTNDGVKADKNTNFTVFTNARIHVNPTKIIENGMFSVRDGKIVSVGNSIEYPKNAVVINLQGKEVYPSFIDLFTSFGIEKPKEVQSNGQPQYGPAREGYYWNDHIRPETTALKNFNYNESEAKKLRKMGFGTVNTHVPDAIIRGTGMLVALNSKGTAGDRILETESAQYLSFDKSEKSNQVYPTSIMGSMALLRQAYLDAQWYAKGNIENQDLALEALNRNKALVQIFKTDNLLNEFRADKVGDEFNIQYVLLGTGMEFKKPEAIKATQAAFIIPLNFPKPFDLENPYMANFVSLQEMKEWNQAPTNLAVMESEEIPFAITAFNNEGDFKKNLLKAIDYGLSKQAALAALTVKPAKILGQEEVLGTIKEGAWANFIITSGDYFNKETILYENWVQGERNIIAPMNTVNLKGSYQLDVAGNSYQMEVTGKPAKPKVKITLGNKKIGSKIAYKNNWLQLLLSSPDTTKTQFTRLIAKIPDSAEKFNGKAILPNGTETNFSGHRTGTSSEGKKEEEKTDSIHKVLPVTFPNKAYGFKTLPKQQDYLFTNATVWTNEAEGILENADVLVKDGKIAEVGHDLNARGAKIIDATGKHLTTGIVDEHSHIAASSINEAGHNSSAEVSMEDAIDPNDINIYRNLAGGVTTIQLLHGSANPIGGKSAILRLKWGKSAEEMIFEESPKFIKFALGENVKQSNWDSRSRFPQTRMGVEQVMVDYFTRAREYIAKKNSGEPYRKDLEMETLAEILNGERNISAHSYVASEILMLMKVAEQFDFKINTFTHILEGYKVAEEMKEHGAGGSTFSDWWAYKYEVKDAIPQNAAIMHDIGITTAINSDDAEMSRHLNQEAAKSVKYGGLSEEEAWKLITLNPAKLLHIEDRVGSIAEGKDADLVLWTGNPLSVYSKPVKTMIQGVVYFDLERDKQMRKTLAQQKNLLSAQMLKAKNNGVETQAVKAQKKEELHCNTIHLN